MDQRPSKLNPGAMAFEPLDIMQRIRYYNFEQNTKIVKLINTLEKKDEDIFALRLLLAEMKIENNRKDEQIATLQNIINNLL